MKDVYMVKEWSCLFVFRDFKKKKNLIYIFFSNLQKFGFHDTIDVQPFSFCTSGSSRAVYNDEVEPWRRMETTKQRVWEWSGNFFQGWQNRTELNWTADAPLKLEREMISKEVLVLTNKHGLDAEILENGVVVSICFPTIHASFPSKKISTTHSFLSSANGR